MVKALRGRVAGVWPRLPGGLTSPAGCLGIVGEDRATWEVNSLWSRVTLPGYRRPKGQTPQGLVTVSLKGGGGGGGGEDAS